MCRLKVPEHRLETVTGKWQGNCTLLHDSCPLSAATTFSRPGRIGHLLFAAPFSFSVPVSADSTRTLPPVCARLFVDPQNCAHAQQLGACWHWAKVAIFCMRPNHRCAPLYLAEHIFEWWAEESPHPFYPLLGNSPLQDYSRKRLCQTPTSHEQPSFPCCTVKILEMLFRYLFWRYCNRWQKTAP